jgi:hypothetical protein
MSNPVATARFSGDGEGNFAMTILGLSPSQARHQRQQPSALVEELDRELADRAFESGAEPVAGQLIRARREDGHGALHVRRRR